MRLKHVKGSQEKIEADIHTIQTDDKELDVKGRWHDIFSNDNPVHIEIGMGKGKFITDLAKQNPNINFIGIEKYSSVLVRAVEKLEEWEKEEAPATELAKPTSETPLTDKKPFKNIIFMRMDAEEIEKYFEKGEVDKIYLNFSDPWPKKRHAKRRLTSREFLERYEHVLKEGGEVCFKTDNRALFDFSVKEMTKAEWKEVTDEYDIHSDGPAKDNVMTEYEERFFMLHKPIYRLRGHI
jgi:tRNA (guanine-N7-)-methyltransferase